MTLDIILNKRARSEVARVKQRSHCEVSIAAPSPALRSLLWGLGVALTGPYWLRSCLRFMFAAQSHKNVLPSETLTQSHICRHSVSFQPISAEVNVCFTQYIGQFNIWSVLDNETRGREVVKALCYKL
jgi:hypothetical protein